MQVSITFDPKDKTAGASLRTLANQMCGTMDEARAATSPKTTSKKGKEEAEEEEEFDLGSETEEEETETEEEETEEEESDELSLDDVREAMKKLAATKPIEKNREKAKSILKKFGVKSTSDLKEKDWPKVMKALKA